jgi:hypothetical protein
VLTRLLSVLARAAARTPQRHAPLAVQDVGLSMTTSAWRIAMALNLAPRISRLLRAAVRSCGRRFHWGPYGRQKKELTETLVNCQNLTIVVYSDGVPEHSVVSSESIRRIDQGI